jgi:glycerate 2-kinase
VSAAIARGLDATFMTAPIAGDAHECGADVARALIDAARHASINSRVLCWGGEPTMRVPSDAPAGGRMQALALAAAQVLSTDGDAARRITMLCAGTDGRDGATDAAGAVVSGATWRALQSRGVDPMRALDARASHAALRAVGALIPAFASGTNLNDVVIALVE